MLMVNQLIGFGAGGPLYTGPIQFVGGATASQLGATSGTTSISLTSGLSGGIASFVQNEDFVIAVFGTGSNTDRTLSITDGTTEYELVTAEISNGITTKSNFRVGYKFVNGDTETVFGPTGATDEAGAMAVYVFRGVNQTTPLDVTPTTNTQGPMLGGNIDPPAITPNTAGAYIVVAANSAQTDGVSTLTTSGLTDFITKGQTETSYDTIICIGHKPDWVSGEFTPADITKSGNENNNDAASSVSIALRPAFPS